MPLTGRKGKGLTGQAAAHTPDRAPARSIRERSGGVGVILSELAVLPMRCSLSGASAPAAVRPPKARPRSGMIWGLWSAALVRSIGRWQRAGQTVVSGVAGRPLRPSPAGGGRPGVWSCDMSEGAVMLWLIMIPPVHVDVQHDRAHDTPQ
jgi:hypothetical protein